MDKTQKDNSGVLFKSTRNPKIDYSGSATIDGQEYWLNAWVNESKKDGSKYLGLSFKLKEDKPVAVSAAADDDIAF